MENKPPDTEAKIAKLMVVAAIRTIAELPHHVGDDDEDDDCLRCYFQEKMKDVMIPLSLKDKAESFKDIPKMPRELAFRIIEEMSSNPAFAVTPDRKCPRCSETHPTAYEYLCHVFQSSVTDNTDGDDLTVTAYQESRPAAEEKKSTNTNENQPERKLLMAAPTPTQTKVELSDPRKRIKETKYKDVQVVRDGDKIILPNEMSWQEGHEWLSRMEEADEQVVAINELVDAYPLEGAYALAQVLDQKFGFFAMVKTPGFFGPQPPVMLSFEVGFKQTTQVPWGRITVPAIDGFLHTSIDLKGQDFIFKIGGQVKAKHKAVVAEIASMVRNKVVEESIYRSKAIYLKFPDPDDKEPDGSPRFNINDCPTFMDPSGFDEGKLIFSDSTKAIIETNILVPITKTAMCRELSIPLKRGILLEGPYGVGKTLTANMTAKVAVENKWTFLYLQKAEDLARAIRFATKYQPAVIFLEDVDRVLDGDRDEDMNAILNTMDGIDSKSSEIITVLTTNHVERFNKASLRPGRLDAVISVRPPDAGAVEKLIRIYSAGKVDTKEDLNEVCQKLAEANTIPAIIREVVERAKLGALRHATAAQVHITADDLMIATESMLQHMDLMKETPEDQRSEMQKLGDSLGEHLHNAVISYSEEWDGKFPAPSNGKKKTTSARA